MLVALAIDSSLTFGEVPTVVRAELSLDESLAQCEPVNAGLGDRVGVPAGAALIDGRAQAACDAYRLRSSCNLSPSELVHDEEVHRALSQ